MAQRMTSPQIQWKLPSLGKCVCEVAACEQPGLLPHHKRLMGGMLQVIHAMARSSSASVLHASAVQRFPGRKGGRSEWAKSRTLLAKTQAYPNQESGTGDGLARDRCGVLAFFCRYSWATNIHRYPLLPSCGCPTIHACIGRSSTSIHRRRKSLSELL